jgi:hypothetical protein
VLQKKYDVNGSLNSKAKKFLSEQCFYGIDIRDENIFRTKLNMFLVGDGHTNIHVDDTLKSDLGVEKCDYIITNPPYGAGTVESGAENTTTKRMEIAFLFKIISLLKDGGKACVVLPDGVLENPSLSKVREEFIEKCDINAIISLPKFAFAPYTKEKTYSVFFTKKNERNKVIQKYPIWVYIIDNDGLANSDKRYPTKLRNNRNGWMHDEISGWVSTDGEEIVGLLEDRWMNFDDSTVDGTEWVNETGFKKKLRKGGFLQIANVTDDKYLTLLPEYYLRKYEPKFLTLDEFDKKISQIQGEMDNLNDLNSLFTHQLISIRKGMVSNKTINFLDIFDEIKKGNQKLTDEAIYQSLQQTGDLVPLWGGNQEHETISRKIPENGRTKDGEEITIFDGEGIIISLDGSAGSMTYKNGQKFALNHHAGFFKVKKGNENAILPEFFAIFYQNKFREMSVSEGSKTLSLKQLYSTDFNIPDIEEQKYIMKKLKPILNKKKYLTEIQNQINKVLSYSFTD